MSYGRDHLVTDPVVTFAAVSGAGNEDFWRRWAMVLSVLVVGGVIAGAVAFSPNRAGHEHGTQTPGSPPVALGPAAQIVPTSPPIVPMPATAPTTALPGPATPTPAAVTALASQPVRLAAPASPTQISPPGRDSIPGHSDLEKTNRGQEATTTPAAIPACPDQVLAVQSQTGMPSYPVGHHTLFRLLITNMGPAACTRDLDPRLRELIVITTATHGRAWSDRDCATVHYPDLRTLQPGVPAVFELRWSGLTSNPQCAGTRTPVVAGAYQLVGRFAGRSSEPTPFTLNP